MPVARTVNLPSALLLSAFITSAVITLNVPAEAVGAQTHAPVTLKKSD